MRARTLCLDHCRISKTILDIMDIPGTFVEKKVRGRIRVRAGGGERIRMNENLGTISDFSLTEGLRRGALRSPVNTSHSCGSHTNVVRTGFPPLR